MKEGIFSRTWARPDSSPASAPTRDRQHERAVAEARDRQRDDDAGQRRHRLDRQVDAAEHDDEGDAGRQDEQHRGVAGELQQRRRLQEHRLHRADEDDEDDERGERQPLPQPVGSEPVDDALIGSYHVPDQVDLPRLVARAGRRCDA